MRTPRVSTALLFAALAFGPATSSAQAPEAKASFEEGMRLKKAKQQEEALAAFERAVARDSSYAAAWSEAGNCLLALARHAEAGERFGRALKLTPGDLTARYNLAYALRQQKRYDDAAREYQLYLEQRPEDADAHYGLAETFKAAGRKLAAAEAFEAYAKTEKRETWKKWVSKARKEAETLRAQAQAEAAATPANASSNTPSKNSATPATAQTGVTSSEEVAVKARPAGARSANFDKGLALMRAGAYEEALPILEAARTQAPQDAMVLGAVAGALLGLRDGEQAGRVYRAALKTALPAAMPALHFGLGEALRLEGDEARASEAYRRAAKHEESTSAIKKLAQDRLATLGG